MQILGFDFRSREEKKRQAKEYMDRVFPGGEKERDQIRLELTNRLPKKDEQSMLLCYIHIKDQMSGAGLSFEQAVAGMGKLQWLPSVDEETIKVIREVMEQNDRDQREKKDDGKSITATQEKVRLMIQIDKELKDQAEELLDELGFSMDQAVTLFLKQAVKEQGIPFDIRRKKQ